MSFCLGPLNRDLWCRVVSFFGPSEIRSFEFSCKYGRQVTIGLLSGRIVAAARNKAYIFNVESCTLIQSFEVCSEDEDCLCAKFSSDGRRVVTCSSDGMAKIWDSQTASLITILRGHSLMISQCSFSPDCRRVITAAIDHSARIWEADSGQQLLNLEHNHIIVWCAAFSNSGERAVTTAGNAAYIWSTETGAHELVLDHQVTGTCVSCAAFSKNDQFLLTGDTTEAARIWNLQNGLLLRILLGQSGCISDCSFSSRDDRILTANQDGYLHIWEVQDCTKSIIISRDFPVYSSVFSEDSYRIAIATGKSIQILDAVSAVVLSEFKFANDTTSCDFKNSLLMR